MQRYFILILSLWLHLSLHAQTIEQSDFFPSEDFNYILGEYEDGKVLLFQHSHRYRRSFAAVYDELLHRQKHQELSPLHPTDRLLWVVRHSQGFSLIYLNKPRWRDSSIILVRHYNPDLELRGQHRAMVLERRDSLQHLRYELSENNQELVIFCPTIGGVKLAHYDLKTLTVRRREHFRFDDDGGAEMVNLMTVLCSNAGRLMIVQEFWRLSKQLRIRGLKVHLEQADGTWRYAFFMLRPLTWQQTVLRFDEERQQILAAGIYTEDIPNRRNFQALRSRANGYFYWRYALGKHEYPQTAKAWTNERQIETYQVANPKENREILLPNQSPSLHHDLRAKKIYPLADSGLLMIVENTQDSREIGSLHPFNPLSIDVNDGREEPWFHEEVLFFYFDQQGKMIEKKTFENTARPELFALGWHRSFFFWPEAQRLYIGGRDHPYYHKTAQGEWLRAEFNNRLKPHWRLAFAKENRLYVLEDSELTRARIVRLRYP